MSTRLASWAPLALLSGGLCAAFALAHGRTAPAPETSEPPAPLVRVVAVSHRDVPLVVRAHGTVAPRTESELVPEISGRVTEVSPALVAGGFFAEGDLLLALDPRDQASAVRRAEATLARAEAEVELRRAQLARLRALAGRSVASEAALDESESAAAIAGAGRDEARAALDDARRALERTRLRAPYAGRVREEWVDKGQFVTAGQPVARLYAIDYAEVRLPLRDEELAWLDLPLDAGAHDGGSPAVPVVLRAFFAGALREWRGRIVRSEGEIDPKSRMLYVVARVDDPYGRNRRGSTAPLAVGLFVDAEIQGRVLHDAIELPRAALASAVGVLAVDGEGRLRRVAVEVLRDEGERMIVRGPLRDGELVCVSDLPGASEGMRVRTQLEDPA